MGVRTQHEGVTEVLRTGSTLPALVLSLSHPLLPAVGARNLGLRENVKDIKSVGSHPSYVTESPGKLAELQTRRSHSWRCLSLVGNGKWGSVCLANIPGDADTASPPWSLEWQLVHMLWCRPGPLPYKMQTVQLQLLQVSPLRWMLTGSWGDSLHVGMA